MLNFIWSFLGRRAESVADRLAESVALVLRRVVIGLFFLWLAGLNFFLAVTFLALATFFNLAELPWTQPALWLSGGLGIWSLILALVGATIIKKK